jgi:hypothetical protein
LSMVVFNLVLLIERIGSATYKHLESKQSLVQ